MITIIEGFTGYPDGKPRHFAAGETPADLSPDYEDLLVAKGHASREPAPTIPAADAGSLLDPIKPF